MSGPSRKPNALKLVSGTARADREAPVGVELAPVQARPAAPDWLPNAHAVKEWDRLTAILVGMKLLTEADLPILGLLCSLHGKLVQLWAAGECPTGAMIAQYRALANDFGMTPVSRSKVKPIGDQDAGNKFAKFKDKPAG